MMFFSAGLLVGLFLVYWFLVRPILRQRAELATFFAAADLREAGFRARWNLFVAGLKSKLWANFIMVAGFLVPLFSMISDGSFDLSSLLPSIPVTDTWQIAPTQYVPLVVVPTAGYVTLKLREATTTPVGVPSEAQVAAIIPDAPASIVEAKTEQIAEAKSPPAASEGKD